MKVMLYIKDSKAPFVMELLQNFPYVKVKPLSQYKAKVLEDLREAVEEMKLVTEGKLTDRNAEDLFYEL